MDLKIMVNVKNRSTATAGYTIPDSGIRRTWEPGEIKKGITVGELEQATYIPGGMVILQDYLLINDRDVCEFLGIEMEPEYFYGEDDIRTLLTTGTLDQLLDCLDFAPDGVLDLIKKIALDMKLNDVSKREAIKNKLKFDVTAALSNVEFANSKDEVEETASKRRATPLNKDEAPKETGRRTAPVSVPKYNKVEK